MPQKFIFNTHVYEGRIDSFLTKKKKETPQRISNLFFTFPFSGKSNHFMQLLWDITFATNEEKHCWAFPQKKEDQDLKWRLL